MLSIVCPGQGAQSPGMLAPWLEILDISDFVDSLCLASGIDLRAHGTSSDAETIQDTAIGQPLIVTAALTAFRALEATIGHPVVPDVVAGHSVGEFAACTIAKAISPEQALSLVSRRGAAMSAAAGRTSGGMSAVLGGDPDEVAAAIESCGLVGANINSAGQTVAAGSKEDLEKLSANPPAKTRIIPLAVAGAFHTAQMASAQQEFAEFAASFTAVPVPARPLWLTNSDGTIVSADRDPLELLTIQITHPVRWDLCQNTMSELGVTGVLELAPAGVLTGLARRTMPGVATFAVKSPEDLSAASDFVLEHSTATH